MYSRSVGYWFLACLILLGSPVKADQNRLTLGIFPYYSSEKLATLHSPLKNYLNQHVDYQVSMRSAPSFKEFAKRTNESQYDLVITAPHLARIAEIKADYRCLAITGNVSYAAFVSASDSKIKNLTDLRGKTLALPPKKAIIHQLALETLRSSGLEPGKDVKLMIMKSHNWAMLAVYEQHADAAAFGLPTWKGAEAKYKTGLSKFAHSKEIPGFAFLAHKKIGPEVNADIEKALFSFPQTEEGQAYLRSTGLEAFIPADETTLNSLDPYIDAMFSKK